MSAAKCGASRSASAGARHVRRPRPDAGEDDARRPHGPRLAGDVLREGADELEIPAPQGAPGADQAERRGALRGGTRAEDADGWPCRRRPAGDGRRPAVLNTSCRSVDITFASRSDPQVVLPKWKP